MLNEPRPLDKKELDLLNKAFSELSTSSTTDEIWLNAENVSQFLDISVPSADRNLDQMTKSKRVTKDNNIKSKKLTTEKYSEKIYNLETFILVAMQVLRTKKANEFREFFTRIIKKYIVEQLKKNK